MKTLLLLRHAKSSWKDPTLTDHDRPLNKRGRKAAPRMGGVIGDQDIVPDVILSSTARRARDTAERAAEAAGYEAEIELREELYHAAPGAYIEAISWLPDALTCVMCVGHNPGMEELVSSLAGEYHRFPTAALAQFEIDTDSWREVASASSRLVSLWLPRELE